MKIFETTRLSIRSLQLRDKAFFSELVTGSEILKLIPQVPFTEKEITNKFANNLNLKLTDFKKQQCVCGVFEKDNHEMIGLALFLIKDNEHELGYRFRKKYWGKGYGKETTKGMLAFYFNILNLNKVIARANIVNTGSINILNKFMSPVKDVFNEKDNCTDRFFELEKKDWLLQKNKGL